MKDGIECNKDTWGAIGLIQGILNSIGFGDNCEQVDVNSDLTKMTYSPAISYSPAIVAKAATTVLEEAVQPLPVQEVVSEVVEALPAQELILETITQTLTQDTSSAQDYIEEGICTLQEAVEEGICDINENKSGMLDILHEMFDAANETMSDVYEKASENPTETQGIIAIAGFVAATLFGSWLLSSSSKPKVESEKEPVQQKVEPSSKEKLEAARLKALAAKNAADAAKKEADEAKKEADSAKEAADAAKELAHAAARKVNGEKESEPVKQRYKSIVRKTQGNDTWKRTPTDHYGNQVPVMTVLHQLRKKDPTQHWNARDLSERQPALLKTLGLTENGSFPEDPKGRKEAIAKLAEIGYQPGVSEEYKPDNSPRLN